MVDETLGLFIVADGVGGLAGGEVASQLATASIHTFIKDLNLEKSLNPESAVKEAMDYANSIILKKAEQERLCMEWVLP